MLVSRLAPTAVFVCCLFAASAVSRGADAVPLQGGTANLSPQNTKIQFICAHVGARPDPRKGGFSKFTGKAQVEGNALKSLTVEIDTASIGTEFEKLTNHLKSPDFFEVRKYPTAKFESTKIDAGSITGTLTLHGVTKEITFPAKVEVNDAGLTVNAEFTLDRSEFGMTYDPKKVENKVSMTVVVGERT